MEPNITIANFDGYDPEIWRLFEKFTFEMIERGFVSFPVTPVLHRVNFELTPTGPRPTKTNLSTGLVYARMFESLHPEHTGFFGPRARRQRLR
jgi:hypothetical protein